jgi:glycosyltransferase involved in cell wall biosynthesis
VDRKTGVLVVPDDPVALAAAIPSALEEPGLGTAGLERAHAEFSVARMADRHVALYERVTA